MPDLHKSNRARGIVCSCAAALILIACAAFLLERSAASAVYTKEVFAMDTFFALRAYGPEAEEALAACERRVEELEGLLSVTRTDSDLYRINQRESFAVSEDTFSVIGSALGLSRETEGALDITLYPILREWGFTTGEYSIPQETTLQALLEKVDYRKVGLTDAGDFIVSVPEGVELDLGAVAKGYTGDCLLALLRERGVTSAMLDLGGNIQVLGGKPDGSAWRVAVRDPFDGGSLGVLEVRDKAVITSGNYERYFVGEDGNIYWHILDPSDGYPADSGLAAVTVVGDDGVQCDGLSTALFVMGKEWAEDYWRRHRDFEMLLVTNDGQLYFTEGLSECFVCSEDWNAEVIRGNETN